MGVDYVPILWNRQKKRYDTVIAGFCLLYLVVFVALNLMLKPPITIETLVIRGFGTLALLLLHIILSIGPLARIDRRFHVLLYNRRHLGVTMFSMALIHGLYSIFQFHTLGNLNPLVSLLSSNSHIEPLVAFPFEYFGILALLILSVMAFTSHDFWLASLGPKTWKALHMGVYFAYGLLILHVVFGAVQNDSSLGTTALLGFGAITIISLHIFSGTRERTLDSPVGIHNHDGVELIDIGAVGDFSEGKAVIRSTEEERVAVFLHEGALFAVSNYCRHQGGPLGEGRIIDGCITCPWHGYQYYPHNGCSPPPFEEKIETYNLSLKGDRVWMDPRPNAPGTEIPPLKIPTEVRT